MEGGGAPTLFCRKYYFLFLPFTTDKRICEVIDRIQNTCYNIV
jgi:hypothetical protein